MRAAWLAEALYFLALGAGALVLGFLLGWTPLWLSLVMILFIVRHLRQLYRLERWLRLGRKRNPPQSWGIWGEVFEHYYRIQRRYYERKIRLTRVIREFRESTAAMPDGTVVLDREWRIQWFNEAAVGLLRLAGNRDLGQPIVNLVRRPNFEAYLKSGDFGQAVEIASPADSSRTLSVRAVPYGDLQCLLLVRDITRLQRLQAMRRDFVANASHELRSPLTVLGGYLESLADDGKAPEEWREPVAEMQAQCRRMSTLVDDLLELSRLETDEPVAPDEQAVNVPAMIRRIQGEARAQDLGRRRLDLELDESLWLAGVDRELHSAFSNLMLNALRYTDEDGAIQIRWRTGDDGSARFEVEDNGIGIDPQHLPFITQRFYRVDASRSRARGGTGLGLAIVKHVLQRHGGRLEVDSQVGAGSRFTCIFPAERVRPAAATTAIR